MPSRLSLTRGVISPWLGLLLIIGTWTGGEATTTSLPNRPDSLKLAVIGDNGTGDRAQYEVADQMSKARSEFPFELVLMAGDNFYGSQSPPDLAKKFDEPYKALLAAGVTFHAAIGNHDAPHTIGYAPLNMGGQRYYTFARRNVRFFVLDTNALDAPQLRWFESALREAREDWKVCLFHHPLYSNGDRHGSSVDIRVLLEPLLVNYDVDVVFSGHDHIYERLTPQKGIQYFVTGSGGQLRKNGIRPSGSTAASFAADQSFLLVEIAGTELFFEAVSRNGTRVDTGTIRLRRQT